MKSTELICPKCHSQVTISQSDMSREENRQCPQCRTPFDEATFVTPAAAHSTPASPQAGKKVTPPDPKTFPIQDAAPEVTADTVGVAADQAGEFKAFLRPTAGENELGRLNHYRILSVLGAGGHGAGIQS